MSAKSPRWMTAGLLCLWIGGLAGCHSCCGPCGSCCPTSNCGFCDPGYGYGRYSGQTFDGALINALNTRSNAIPDRYPVGSVMRAHFAAMETNAEASDFVVHQHEFVGETAELTPDGKDHILEIGARMRSAPFPVLVERSENNANPELDAERRYIVASALHTLGNGDADQRTIVSPTYGVGQRSMEAEADYYRYVGSQGNVAGFNNGNNAGFNNGGNIGFGFR